MLDYLPKSSRFLAQNQNDKNIPAIKTCSGYDFSFEKLRGNFNVPNKVLHNKNGIYLNNKLCNLSKDSKVKKQNKTKQKEC